MKPDTRIKYDPSQLWSSEGSLAIQNDALSEGPSETHTRWRQNQYFIYSQAVRPHKILNPNSNPLPETMPLETPADVKECPKPVVFLRHVPLIQDRFLLLQKWEGSVERVEVDHFVARLVDQTGHMPDEVAEFPLEEVPAADHILVKSGAVFYWNIGYQDSIGGQRIRASVIRFRRLPVWSAHELQIAKQNAERTRDLINWK